MNIIKTILICLYLGIVVSNLVFIINDMQKARKISKCFIVLTLLITLIFSKQNILFLYLGLFFSLIGDFILLSKEKKLYFIIGASFFALAHISYFCLTTKLLPSTFNFCYYGIVILLGYLVIEALNEILKKYLKNISVFASIYFYLEIAIIINSICGALFNYSIASLFILVGALCFLASDIFLMISYFIKKTKYKEFIVMLLYSLAQLLIAFSFIIDL